MEKEAKKEIYLTSFVKYCRIATVVFCAFFALNGADALAATIYLSPNSKSLDVGDTFSIGVFVSSDEMAMNAAQSSINFPKDKLRVLSISKTGSIISMWAREPIFSNANGTVNMEGVVFNPGYKGQAGKVVVINFEAISAGKASVSFESASVLANDGKGTNILSGMAGASFIIAPKHETTTSIKAIRADTAPPIQLSLAIVKGDDGRAAKAYLSAKDDGSGLAYYELKIDGGSYAKVKPEEASLENPYEIAIERQGAHTVAVRAFDRAGNHSEISAKFIAQPSAPASSAALAVFVTLLVLSALFHAYSWVKLSRFRVRLREFSALAEENIHQAFDGLRGSIMNGERVIEKTKLRKDLVKKVESASSLMLENLDDAEGIIKKSVKNIEKEIYK